MVYGTVCSFEQLIENRNLFILWGHAQHPTTTQQRRTCCSRFGIPLFCRVCWIVQPEDRTGSNQLLFRFFTIFGTVCPGMLAMESSTKSLASAPNLGHTREDPPSGVSTPEGSIH